MLERSVVDELTLVNLLKHIELTVDHLLECPSIPHRRQFLRVWRTHRFRYNFRWHYENVVVEQPINAIKWDDTTLARTLAELSEDPQHGHPERLCELSISALKHVERAFPKVSRMRSYVEFLAVALSASRLDETHS
jgi:hypothetical protein